MRISPLAAASKSVQGAMRSSGPCEAMNSDRRSASSRVKPNWFPRGSELPQRCSMMCIRKHQPVTQHEHGGQRWCPTAPPGFWDDDTCCWVDSLGRQPSQWAAWGHSWGHGLDRRARNVVHYLGLIRSVRGSSSPKESGACMRGPLFIWAPCPSRAHFVPTRSRSSRRNSRATDQDDLRISCPCQKSRVSDRKAARTACYLAGMPWRAPSGNLTALGDAQ